MKVARAMKAGRDYSWWVAYAWEFELYYDGEWSQERDFDEGRFDCQKKDIKKVVTEHVKSVELKDEVYRNLKVIIQDCYMTTTCEV